MFDLKGKAALVTGAGQKTGAGIARTLSSLGAAVAINDRVADRAEKVADDIAVSGGRAVAIPFDVTDFEAVGAPIKKLGTKFAPLDIWSWKLPATASRRIRSPWD